MVSGSTISSTTHNTLVSDLQTALSTAVLKDGQQTITANIPFNSNKITGLGAATSAGDAVRKDQVNIVDPPTGTDSGTDTFEFDAGYDLSTGDTVTVDFGSANTTASPTLENTGGAPAGAQSIVTTAGAAFIGMIQARPHRLQWDGTNYILLDPAQTVTQTVRKTSNETISASTTLQNDDDLKFEIAANETVIVHGVLYVNSATAVDFRTAWSIPTGCTGEGGIIGLATSVSGVEGSVRLEHSTDLTTRNLAGGAGTNSPIHLSAVFINGSTAGTVNLQWAQRVSDVSNTSVRVNSHLIIWRF